MRAMLTINMKQSASSMAPEAAQALSGKMADLFAQRLSWARIRPQMVRIYKELFSETELEGIVSFYESPAGKAMLNKMPELMKRSMQMGTDLMGDVQADVRKLIEESAAKPKKE